ncbi:phosphotransferase family protein [Tepidiforma sp.]|uniref:phosphotransferase family protein n=1 Tax=Tepidiforma sp. TaxID=2682230 RepID=UPI00258C3203|nr:phosphotransferase family protein [Tepidiforma sp.]
MLPTPAAGDRTRLGTGTMELDELQARLVPFVREKLGDPGARVENVRKGPGHAGFSYFFDAVLSSGERREYFLRLPPPGVKLEGTADLMRQVTAVRALEGTGVPHAPILWAGTEPDWFGLPYFVQPRLPGDTLKDDYPERFSDAQLREMARQAMTALAGIHRVPRERLGYLGEFWGYEFDVTRWDRFYERAAEPELLALQPRVKELLLRNIPHEAPIGLYHGDFQWSNLLYSPEGELLAVIDWELCGVGPTLNDLGWVCVFSDPSAWAHDRASRMPHADELEAWYWEAMGGRPGDIRWFKALAAYKFGIITGFNLMLHRRGKRHDPHWEEIAPSMQSNMEYALRMLGG